MITRPDSRQIEQRQALPTLGVAANRGQNDVNAAANTEFDQPLRLRAAFPTPDDRLYFSDSSVAAADGGNKVAAPVSKQVFDDLSGLYVDFQDQSVSSAPDFDIEWPVSNTVGRFRRAAVALTTAGQIAVVFGDEALTQGALANPGPLFPRGSQPLGYLDLECTDVAGYFKTAGSATDVIENTSIYRFASGAGGGAAEAEEFAIANNQASPADVTGFVIDSAENKQFVAEVSLERRYAGEADGTEDAAFYANFNSGNGLDDAGFAVKTQADGKVLVGGDFFALSSNQRIVRINEDGSQDLGFSSNITPGANNSVQAFDIQSDDKILVGGSFTSFAGNTRSALVRLNTDGTEDTAFYTNLYSVGDNTAFGGSSVVAIAVQNDGKIVCGGFFTTLNGANRSRLVRLNTDGTEDTAFYTNLGTGFGGAVNAIVIQSDGKIVVGGQFNTFNSNTRNRLVRLNSDGTEDTAFYTNLGTGFGSTVLTLSLQSDGKIIAGGQFATLNSNTRNRLVRLNSDGTEDTAFYTNLGTGFVNSVFTTKIQINGKIVVGGNLTLLNGNTRNRLVRLNSDGTEDTAFYTGLGGAFDNGDGQVRALDIGPQGKIPVVGGYLEFDLSVRNRIVILDSPPSQELLESFSLRGYYSDLSSQWSVAEGPGFGLDTGVDFTMTSGGQLQYTSTDIGGTELESRMRFLITRI